VNRSCLPALCALALAVVASAARADIFAYTDDAGVVHYSNVPDSPRYQLMVRTPMADEGRKVDQKITAGWLARAADYDDAIEGAARESTIHPALVRAVIVVESGFNPRAISRKGAMGLMQLLPSTARRYGAFNALDPVQNIYAGVRCLAALLVRYDSNVELALAAYNAGEAAVERYGRRIPPYRETRKYVPSVLAVYRALRANTLQEPT
jgi:soluble lytic murein transglycosylase-like protein